MSQMSNAIKGLVSKKKRRFKDDEFDLDLSIIRRYIIAMGYPADNLEGVYRNRIDDVVRFLDRDYADRYRIYNLCSERDYDPAKFHNRVVRFPFDDHHPPKLTMMEAFCRDARKWLESGDKNVVVVHCKAGKGRTGVMICAFLVYAGLVGIGERCTVLHALRDYDHLRTYNLQGVTIPSQIRYVFYFGALVAQASPDATLSYQPLPLVLRAVRLSSPPSYNSNGLSCPYFRVRQRRLRTADGEVPLENNDIDEKYKSAVFEPQKKDSPVLFVLDPPPLVCGDVLIEFYNKSKMSKKERMCHFWFNTYFIVNPVHHYQTEHQLELEARADRSDLTAESQQPNHADSRERTKSTGVIGKAYIRRSSSDEQPFEIVDLENDDRNRSAALPAGAEQCITVEFPKAYLDKAVKDKEHFPSSFSIRLYFSTIPDAVNSAGHSAHGLQSIARNGAPLMTNVNAGAMPRQPTQAHVAPHFVASGSSQNAPNRIAVNSNEHLTAPNASAGVSRITRQLQPVTATSSVPGTASPQQYPSLNQAVRMQAQLSTQIAGPTSYTGVRDPRFTAAPANPTVQPARLRVARVNSNEPTTQAGYVPSKPIVSADDSVRTPILRAASGSCPPDPSMNFMPSQSVTSLSPSRVVQPASTVGGVQFRTVNALVAQQQPTDRCGCVASPSYNLGGTTSTKVDSNGGYTPAMALPHAASVVTSTINSPLSLRIVNNQLYSALNTAKFPPTAQPEASDDDDDRTYDDTEDDTDDTDDDLDPAVAESTRQVGDLRFDENSNTCASISVSSKRATSPNNASTTATGSSDLSCVSTQNYSVTSLV